MLDNTQIKILTLIKSNGGKMIVDEAVSDLLSVSYDEFLSACKQLEADGYLSKIKSFIDGSCQLNLSYKGYQITNSSVNPVADSNHIAEGKSVDSSHNKRLKDFVNHLTQPMKAVIAIISIVASIITIWAFFH